MTADQSEIGTAETRPTRLMEHHDLLAGLVRLHVLHHAAEHEIYGQWMIDELASHGYRLSAGTLYPLLHKLARDGYHVPPDAELRLEYWLLKDPKQKTWDAEINPDFLASTQAGSLVDGLRRIGEQAIAGRFAPRPMESEQTCAYCTYTALCRYWTSGAGAEAGRNQVEANGVT